MSCGRFAGQEVVDDGWGTRGRTGDDERSVLDGHGGRSAPDPDPDLGLDPDLGGALLVFLEGPIERAEIPELCARFAELVGDRPGRRVICDVAGLAEPDVVAVETLTRLQLTARRLGCRLWLRQAGCGLRHVIALAGLTDVLPLAEEPTECASGRSVRSGGSGGSGGSGIQPRRQPEQREPPVGVEEIVQPDDPAP